jgi:hypothetical protein
MCVSSNEISPSLPDAMIARVANTSLCQLLSLGQGQSERLVAHHVLARAQSCSGEREMAVVRAGDHNQFERRVRRHRQGIAMYRDLRQIRMNGLGPAGRHDR